MSELLGKERTLELFSTLIPRIPQWYLVGIQDFAELPDRKKSALGKRMLAGWVQRLALSEAQTDPVVNAGFVPIMYDQLECIVLDGEKGCPSVALFLNMARRSPDGILRTSRQRTERHWDRRAGSVTLFGREMIPVICFWEPHRTQDYVINPTARHFGIGEEGPRGFYWAHTFGAGGEGFGGTESDSPLLPNMPGPIVRLRKPEDPQTGTVGYREADRQRAEAERLRLPNQSDNIG